MRRPVLLAAALLLVALAVPTMAAAKRSHHIDPKSGIGGIKLGMHRGPLKHHRTVRSLLGPDDDIISEGQPRIYLATYEDADKGLGVYLRSRPGHKRGARDKVVGVVTYSDHYHGRLEVGKHFPAPDHRCAPADKRSAPGGGPRRVSACRDDPPGPANVEDIVYMALDAQTRAGQTIAGVGVFDNMVGAALFSALVEGALDDLGCDNRDCD